MMKHFLKEFWLGITTYPQAIDFIKKHKLNTYLVLPAIFSALIFTILALVSYLYIGELTAYLDRLLHRTSLEGFWYRIAQWIVNTLVWLFVGFAYLKLYRYLILILLSPFLGLIASKVQDILHQQEVPFDLGQLLKDVLRGILISLRNLVWELLFTSILMFLSLVVPFLSPFTVVMILLVESYYVGFSMIDYRNEYKKIPFRQSILIVRSHRGFAIANGLAFNFLVLIPIIGVLFAPMLSAVAAGIGIHKIEH
jgi:CysZ protein